MAAQTPSPRPSPSPSRQRLIDATIELVRERGVGAVLVEEVARRAGVTTGSLYWHFSGRDELLVAASQYLSDIANDAAQAEDLASEPDLAGVMARLAAAHATLLREHPEVVRLDADLVALADRSPGLGDELRTRRRARAAPAEVEWQRLAETLGADLPLPPLDFALCLRALLLGLGMVRAEMGEDYVSDELVQRALKLLAGTPCDTPCH